MNISSTIHHSEGLGKMIKYLIVIQDGNTALHLAVMNNDVRVASLLLHRGRAHNIYNEV